MKTHFFICFLMAFLCNQLQSQIISGNAFLQGNYVEVGINTCGAFATPVLPPIGYHPNSTGLSFVADRDKDGWDVGSPLCCGDFAIPGSPIEGWSLQVDGTVGNNTDQFCSPASVSGDVEDYYINDFYTGVSWVNEMYHGLRVTHEVKLGLNDLYVLNTIKLYNIDGPTAHDIYYRRNIDPDPEAAFAIGGYTTLNTIVHNPPIDDKALLTAVSEPNACYIAFGTLDDRARVSFGGFGITYGTNEEAYNGTGVYTGIGDSLADIAIQLTFYIPEILPYDSAIIRFAYIFDPSVEVEALIATDPDFICKPPSTIHVTTTDTSANISWDPVFGADNYTLKYRSSGAGPWTTIADIITPELAINGLNPCTNYTYKLFTSCDTVNSAIVINNFTTNCPPCTYPPSDLLVDNITPTSAKLHWNMEEGATKYTIAYGPVDGPTVKLNAPINEKTLTGLTPGTDYVFKVKSICGPGISSPYSAFSNFSTLLKTGITLPVISAYPNPASDVLNVDLKNLSQGDLTIAVYNLLGGLMTSQTTENAETNYSTQLNTINFASGMYILQVEQSGYKQIEQIIISK